MADYYSFPLGIMLLWPSIASLLFQQKQNFKQQLYYLQLALIILTFSHSMPFYEKTYPLIKLDNITNGSKFSSEINAKLYTLNRPLFTWSVATLNPDIYEQSNLIKSGDIPNASRPIFYFNVNQDIYEIATKNSYIYKYKIKNTPIRILSNTDLTNIFTNLQPNTGFWIDALSLSKKYMYQETGENMSLGVSKIKNLKKKPLFFASGNYCATIKQDGNKTLLFAVSNMDDSELYRAQITSNNDRKCFRVAEPTTLYLTLSTITGTTILKEFDIQLQ